MRLWIQVWLSCILLVLSSAAWAVDVRLVGIFSTKALVKIDGKQKVIKQGVPMAEGVTLVSTTKNSAVVSVAGKEQTLKLGASTYQSGGYAKPKEGKVFQVVRDNTGMYSTVGSINGRTVNMLVDTGASSVAMNANEAKRLGIPFRLKGTKSFVATASGIAKAYTIMLKKVKIGSIELTNVEGTVVDGSSPREVLLGMSFLGRLQVTHEGNLMKLKKKY
ncbi:MAG: retroviral-like aspartic protease family protein [Methylococcales bacterium]|jgi:aspartyl protease family protein|nr:retroviral-like aspartic protease family protein [Methylococcales bacterium]MBT7445945.1 retroviral-like aspartic protease family protein [Methylococcales bacterium]